MNKAVGFMEIFTNKGKTVSDRCVSDNVIYGVLFAIIHLPVLEKNEEPL